MEANRFFTYPLNHDVAYSYDLVMFLNGVAAFFYSVVALPRSAVPFTLRTAECSVSALQHSQHCNNFYSSQYIPPVFLITFLQGNLKVLLRFFQVNFVNQWDRRKPISIVECSTFKLTLIELTNSLHCPEVCSSFNSSIHSWILFQYSRSPFTE